MFDTNISDDSLLTQCSGGTESYGVPPGLHREDSWAVGREHQLSPVCWSGSSSSRWDIVFYKSFFSTLQWSTQRSTKNCFHTAPIYNFYIYLYFLFTKLEVSMFPTHPCPSPGLYQINLRSPHS